MKFKIGESVICVSDSFVWARANYRAFNITWPKLGHVYVVRCYTIQGSHPAIVLQGIVNPKVPYLDNRWREAGFWEERFARAPDISDFRKIADEVSKWLPVPVEQNETEDA